MKNVVQFKPRGLLDIDTFKILAFVAKLVLVEKWEKMQAVYMACNFYGYYNESDAVNFSSLFDKFMDDGAFEIVAIPNRIKKRDIGQYLKDNF